MMILCFLLMSFLGSSFCQHIRFPFLLFLPEFVGFSSRRYFLQEALLCFILHHEASTLTWQLAGAEILGSFWCSWLNSNQDWDPEESFVWPSFTASSDKAAYFSWLDWRLHSHAFEAQNTLSSCCDSGLRQPACCLQLYPPGLMDSTWSLDYVYTEH